VGRGRRRQGLPWPARWTPRAPASRSAAWEIARSGRTILAARGITNAQPVMRHAANLESVLTYEATSGMHTLIVGRAITGLDALSWVSARCRGRR
jgi:glutaryl-CoA dehydrogenase